MTYKKLENLASRREVHMYEKSTNRKFDQVVGFLMQRHIYICTFVANDN